MFTIPLGDGFTTAQVDGTLDPSLPLVVLLHGLGGSSLDMTNPIAVRGGVAFNRSATFPVYTDRGFSVAPPALPVHSFFMDPPATSLTSWSQALVNAGFSTISYNQSGATIAPNVTQLTTLATGPLSTDSRLSGMRIAFVGHSRGGLIARSFLTTAAATPALGAFLRRVTTLITLHSPNTGSGVANLAVTVDGLLARVGAALTAAGVGGAAGFITMLRGFTGSPAFLELTTGSAVIAGIAAAEPVSGITYHTFGGTNTAFARFWANVFTPDSTIPIPIPFVPFPLFHHGTTPVVVGAPLNVASFVPIAVLAPMPVVTELITAMTLLAATTPELAPGSGDVLVSDARARLPFSASHTTNALNHAEALWDPTLQSQVVAILSRLRTPGVSGQAVARISPFPVRTTAANYVVTASDAVSGMPLTTGTVTVRDTFGAVARSVALGSTFNYTFSGRRVLTIGPRGEREWETLYSTVDVTLPPPYGTVSVDTGQP
jgi:pimeloyl-ACP methyl ester carboxylesterase